MHSLTVGPSGTLHITFQYHFAASGSAADCRGRAVAHLQSDDGGDTWINGGRQRDDLPLTFDAVDTIARRPEGDSRQHGLRVGNHAVDAEDNPWFLGSSPGTPSGLLWHRSPSGWERTDLARVIPNLDLQGGRSTALSRDAQGHLHLLIATNPDGKETPWFHPTLELFHVILGQHACLLACTQLTETDSSAAHWLPSVEQWDWTRPEECCVDGLWFAYTRGLNAGGIGGDNKSALKTEVYLSRLPGGSPETES